MKRQRYRHHDIYSSHFDDPCLKALEPLPSNGTSSQNCSTGNDPQLGPEDAHLLQECLSDEL